MESRGHPSQGSGQYFLVLVDCSLARALDPPGIVVVVDCDCFDPREQKQLISAGGAEKDSEVARIGIFLTFVVIVPAGSTCTVSFFLFPGIVVLGHFTVLLLCPKHDLYAPRTRVIVFRKSYIHAATPYSQATCVCRRFGHTVRGLIK